jgi:hypothetical protein
VVDPTAIVAAPRVMVSCGLCGMRYDVGERTARYIKSGRRVARCTLHRAQRPRPQTRTLEFRQFWLDRFADDEIVFMGTSVEMTLTGRGSVALVASASLSRE